MRGALLAAAWLALATPAAAAKRPDPASTLPPWVREAAARPLPSTTSSVILHDELIVEPLEAGGVRMTRRIAVRVLTADALEDSRAFDAVRGADDEVVSAEAWNVLPDGEIVRPDPKRDVSDVPLSDSSMIDGSRARHVELPGVEVGSVVAFESVVVEAIDAGATSFLFGDVDVPTALARATLRVPPNWTFETIVRHGSPAETRDATSVTLELSGLVPPKPDPFPPADAELLPVAWLRWFSPDGSRGFRDWAAVGRWYRELTEQVGAEARSIEPLSRGFAPASPADLRAAIDRAFAYASKDVRYVAVEIGIGGFKPASPDATCRDKFGDCKAKAFLVRSLVKPWGVRAWPVIVRTRDLGPVDEDVATPAQFNHAIVAMELRDGMDATGWATATVPGVGKVAFLDATITASGSAPLRSDDQDTLGLLVHETATQLVRIPAQAPEQGGTRMDVDLRVDESGAILEGRLAWTSIGQDASAIRFGLASRSSSDRMGAMKTWLQSMAPGATLASYEPGALDEVGTPLVGTLIFSGGKVGKRAMDLLVLQPGAFAPAVLDDDPAPGPRPWPFDVDAPRGLEAVVTVHPPAGWRVEAPLQPWSLETPWITASTAWEIDRADALVWRRSVRVLVARVPPDDYPAFRKALSNVAGHDAEGLTLVEDTVKDQVEESVEAR